MTPQERDRAYDVAVRQLIAERAGRRPGPEDEATESERCSHRGGPRRRLWLRPLGGGRDPRAPGRKP